MQLSTNAHITEGLLAAGLPQIFSMFLFLLSDTLLNDKVCEHHFAIKALEYGNDLGTLG